MRRPPSGADATGTGQVATYSLHQLRRRTLVLLSVGQILGGLGVGPRSRSGLAASDLAGAAWSAIGATMTTLGAAVLAIPLAQLADRSGRRVSLSTAALIAAAGAVVCVLGMSVGSVVLLFAGLGLIGAAAAGGLQSRFAATDLAEPANRGRDLSLVVWSTTIGAVMGPNLAEPGNILGAALGLQPLAGLFLFPLVAQLLAAAAYLIWMRPDPLLVSRRLAAVPDLTPTSGPRIVVGPGSPTLVRVAIVTVSLSHATMVALMAMTPVSPGPRWRGADGGRLHHRPAHRRDVFAVAAVRGDRRPARPVPHHRDGTGRCSSHRR